MKQIFLLILASCTLTTYSQRSNLLLEQTFDSSVGSWFENSTYYPYSATISSYTARAARAGKSLKLELRKGENMRAELGTNPQSSPKEGWYGFTLFFPSGFVADDYHESIMQFQSFPDPGENWRSAVMFLGVVKDRLILAQWSDSNKISVQGSPKYSQTDFGQLEKSKWLDFVIHARWAYDATGFIEIWKDNKLLLRKSGPNCYNDNLNPYFKIGIYKWDFSLSPLTKRELYVDEVRIGNANANYFDVFPGKISTKTINYFNDGSSLITPNKLP